MPDGGNTKTHAGLSASSMTSLCDLISSSYIVMTEDLTWLQTQSADPFSDEVAVQEKQTEETVCLGWTTDPGTPVIQVFFSVNWQQHSQASSE